MAVAYSRLRFLLDERSLTSAELRRRIAADDGALDVKSLYRLADPNRPLERIDLRIAGAICRALGVGLDELIVFSDDPSGGLPSLPAAKQRRLDELMDRHNDGSLADGELVELRRLVAEAEQIARSNARRLAEHRRRLRSGTGNRAPN